MSDATSRYIDSAVVLAALTAAVYFAGWNYTDAYLSALALDHLSHDLPASSYPINAFWPAMLFLPFLPFLFSTSRDISEEQRRAIALQTLVLIGATMSGLGLSGIVPEQWAPWLIGAGILLPPACLVSKRSLEFIQRAAHPNSTLERLAALVGTAMLVMMASRGIGAVHGQGLVRGESTRLILVELKAKTEPLRTELAGPSVLLLLHNRTYFVSKQPRDGNQFRVYVVPMEELEYAVQYRPK